MTEDDWIDHIDLDAIANPDDKIHECDFFFRLMSTESNRERFRWLVSAFLNAAYSFFESSSLCASVQFTHPEFDQPLENSESIAILRRYVIVNQNRKNPYFVKTSALHPVTKQLYEFRKVATHHFPLSVMATGPNLPEDFHFGSIRGESTPVLPLCRDVMALIRTIFDELQR